MLEPTAKVGALSPVVEPADFVFDAVRLNGCTRLGAPFWRRFEHFLDEGFAEKLAADLTNALVYERVDYAGYTQLWRASRKCGDAYFGELISRGAISSIVEAGHKLFESALVLDLLSRLGGSPVRLMRPPTTNLLKRGDRICLHDDMSDPSHCLSVILGLTKNWRKGDGGETVFGEVDSTQNLPTPPDVPFQLKKWTLRPNSFTLPPAFNSLTVLKLSTELAHGVNVVTSDEDRLSMVALYGQDIFA